MIRELRTFSTEHPLSDEQWALIQSHMEQAWALALADESDLFVAALGDPFEGGMKIYGPFVDADEAIRYAEGVEAGAHDWHVVQVWPVE